MYFGNGEPPLRTMKILPAKQNHVYFLSVFLILVGFFPPQTHMEKFKSCSGYFFKRDHVFKKYFAEF